MDYFSPGIRELARIAARWRDRWHLRTTRAELARQETELGLLGWQQADFDEATQREVDKILAFEREQSRMTNESAELSNAVAQLIAQREQARLLYEDHCAPLNLERQTIRESMEKRSAQLPPLRRQTADSENREPQLDREVREADRMYKDLLAMDTQTPELRDQQSAMRERMNAIPLEIAEGRRRRARLLLEIEELQKALAHESERDAVLARTLREIETTHTAADRKLADMIAASQRERDRIELVSARLEKKKVLPYREIGRVLADCHVAPMNQPQALEVVRTNRVRVQELEYGIAKSRADSAAEDRALTQNSLILLAAAAVAVLLVLGALIHW